MFRWYQANNPKYDPPEIAERIMTIAGDIMDFGDVEHLVVIGILPRGTNGNSKVYDGG